MNADPNQQVVNSLKLDKNCMPYPRKAVYWLINLPYLALLVLTAVYLWKQNLVIACIYISFYIVSVILHGYVCSHSECPYKGTMCPGAFAWAPVGKIAKLFNTLKIKKSESLIGLFFMIIMLSLLGILILPQYWIAKQGIVYNIGYTFLIIVYFFAFILTICPKCAGRLNCPTAKLSNLLYNKLFKKDILRFD